ncbi:MAG TPA: cell division protein ZapE, partial [Steroidobacteraceae bacterium]|nr:cell division protein ZapE [Steroidobacteraceae bacterium]
MGRPQDRLQAASGSRTVLERWSAEVAARRLQFDGAQRAAALELDALRGALRAREPTLFTRLRASVPWLADEPRTPPRGLYLWGGVGRGKTLLMDLFFASVAQRHGSPRIAERSHFYHFMRDVHSSLGKIKTHADPLDLVAQRLSERARVICLDEFFVADIADAMILARLFDGLFRRGVALVATSNVPPQDLYKDGLQRLRFLPAIELIRTHVEIMQLDGGIDYRLRQLERAPTYMDSGSTATPAALEERFAALTGAVAEPGAIKECALTVEGRELNAVRWTAGTAWFEFVELCEGPRSQLDYIELAHLFHTIFISNIPTFGHVDDDAARRFIMLIDELYDRGV